MSTPFGIPIKSGIGRLLDVNHRSNRYAMLATIGAGLITLVWRLSTGAEEPWAWAFRVAVGFFLAWAIGRELDPDDTGTAVLASFVVIPLMALGPPSLASSAAALLAARIAVRTTGVSPHVIDGIVLTAGAAYLGANAETWPALGILLLAVGTDRYSDPPGPNRTLVFAAAMTIIAMITAVAFAEPLDWLQPTIPEWIVLAVVAVAGFLAIGNTQTPTSRADFHPGELSETRLRFGRVLALFALVVGTIYLGGPIVPTLTPLWAAAFSVTAVHFYRRAAAGLSRPQPPM